jgi:cyclopropane-fatty-acyl-phospholipid synthase
MAITDLIYAPLDGLRRYAGSVSWGPAVQLSRTTLLGLLSRITVGRLKVIDTDGTETICGFKGTGSEPETELVIHKDTFWVRMLLFADMVGPRLLSARPWNYRS